jgi:hypothetical protein
LSRTRKRTFAACRQSDRGALVHAGSVLVVLDVVGTDVVVLTATLVDVVDDATVVVVPGSVVTVVDEDVVDVVVDEVDETIVVDVDDVVVDDVLVVEEVLVVGGGNPDGVAKMASAPESRAVV